MTDTRQAIDFDHHTVDFADNHNEILAEMRSKCPVAWTDNYGGFWVVTDYDDVNRIAQDDDHFSSQRSPVEGSQGAILIPPDDLVGSLPALPVESDPPLTNDIRRVLMPYFSPAAAKEREPRMQMYVDELIDAVIGTGEIDFVEQLGGPAPLRYTYELMGLPVTPWKPYDRGSEETYSTKDDMLQTIMGLPDVIADRRANPRNDMVSLLVQSQMLGKPTSDEITIGILTSLISGGSDTSTALFANSVAWLAQHPDHRKMLIDDPQLVGFAVEEFLRYFPSNLLLGRTALADVEVGGQTIKRGERLLMSWAAANRDPEVFEHPDDVILDRPNNRHTTFGVGVHRCLGMHHARMEARVLLSTVFRRLPDYEILWDEVHRYRDLSASDGYICMPARFTPGPKVLS
jgi:cytochrome P450